MMDQKKFICACFFTRNIFLKKYCLHVIYENDRQFIQDYRKILYTRGCVLDDQINEVRKKIIEEIDRRKGNGVESRNRKNLIQRGYIPLHKDLYTLNRAYLHPDFIHITEYVKMSTANRDGLLQLLGATQASEVFSIPIFTPSFCERFIEELKHFEDTTLPKGRPNSMNTTGILLEELGFYSKFLDTLRDEYLSPIATLLYPNWIGKTGLDSQRAFIVTYQHDVKKEDTDLDLHFDNAEITLNISLCDSFTGGELFFGDMRTEAQGSFKRVVHRLGQGIFHRGQQFHGAMPLESGERYNLIIWMRSSSIRNSLCPMCDKVPTLIETEGDGDGFTAEEIVDVCSIV